MCGDVDGRAAGGRAALALYLVIFGISCHPCRSTRAGATLDVRASPAVVTTHSVRARAIVAALQYAEVDAEVDALFALVGAVVRAAFVLVDLLALWRAGGGRDAWVVRVWRCGWASRGRAGGSGNIPLECRNFLSSLPSHSSRCNARRPSQPSSRNHPMGPGSCNTRRCTRIQLAPQG